MSSNWNLNVERGPNWLFVKATCGDVGYLRLSSLAEQLRWLLEQHFTNRLVLELDQIDLPLSDLNRQLELLDEWVRAHNGLVRLCGLSPDCATVLQGCGLGDQFPVYRNRRDAVFGDVDPGSFAELGEVGTNRQAILQ
jgi:hypothetical protein